MKISKERFHELMNKGKHSAGGHVSGLMGRAKHQAPLAAIGAGVAVIMPKVVPYLPEMVTKHPWGEPLAVFAVGAYASKKYPRIGAALCTIAGYQAGEMYTLGTLFSGGQQPTNAKGDTDAGGWQTPGASDAGAEGAPSAGAPTAGAPNDIAYDAGELDAGEAMGLQD